MSSNEQPLVSVILPNYNHAQFLKQRIESILTQTYTNFELVIIDDCSADDSLTVIDSFRNDKRISHVVRNTQNSGSTFPQWKKGMELSRGKYIWIAESDDYCAQNFLDTAVKSLNSGADLFYCQSVIVDEAGNEVPAKTTWYDDLSVTRWKSSFTASASDEVSEFLSVKNTIPNASAVVFRKTGEVLTFCGSIQGMRYCGDWIFWLKYLLRAKTLSFSIDTVNYFRVHAAVTRRNTDHGVRNKEITQVLRFILTACNPKRTTKELVHYFCRIHYTAYRGIRSVPNFLLTLRLMSISKYFWSGWRTSQ